MEPLIQRNFRPIAILLVLLGIWNGLSSHPHLSLARDGLALSLAALWTIAILLMQAVRSHRVRGVVTAVSFAAAAGATLAYPPLATLLMVSVGMAGARLPWREVRRFGLAVVLLASLVFLAAAKRAAGQVFAIASVDSAKFVDVILTLGVIFLFGRFVADNVQMRSEQARALEELQKAHAELQRHAEAVEELATLRERVRLSRELHDTLGHALSVITVQIEAARRLLPKEPAQADSVLRDTQQAARAAMHDLRLHLSAMREPLAPHQNLSEALRRLAEEFAARNGWTLRLDLKPVDIPEPGRRALWQMAKEALANAERHARAHSVLVQLEAVGDTVRLTVVDDGRGFNPASVSPGHFGLQGMRERLAELGGKLSIRSAPQAGTEVSGSLPRAADPGRAAP